MWRQKPTINGLSHINTNSPSFFFFFSETPIWLIFVRSKFFLSPLSSLSHLSLALNYSTLQFSSLSRIQVRLLPPLSNLHHNHFPFLSFFFQPLGPSLFYCQFWNVTCFWFMDEVFGQNFEKFLVCDEQGC